eukprot:TRINITY_DN97157_c0_g1_i1.p1 TRINITY_DN97157_c0_g1~~TRINITY_DN97157_c0_g1_i1.p1  ORF type:complete len:144 (-),score=16.88 TRINITY_DN97157_c0_g1_i1:55-486(-)
MQWNLTRKVCLIRICMALHKFVDEFWVTSICRNVECRAIQVTGHNVHACTAPQDLYGLTFVNVRLRDLGRPLKLGILLRDTTGLRIPLEGAEQSAQFLRSKHIEACLRAGLGTSRHLDGLAGIAASVFALGSCDARIAWRDVW